MIISGVVKGDCKDAVDSANGERQNRNQVLSPLELAAGKQSWRHLGTAKPLTVEPYAHRKFGDGTLHNSGPYELLQHLPHAGDWRGGFALTGHLQSDQLPGCTRRVKCLPCSVGPSMG